MFLALLPFALCEGEEEKKESLYIGTYKNLEIRRLLASEESQINQTKPRNQR